MQTKENFKFFDTHQLFRYEKFNIIAGCKNYSTFLKKNLYTNTSDLLYFSNLKNDIRSLNTKTSLELNKLIENRPTYIVTRDPKSRLESQLSHVLLYRLKNKAIKSFDDVNFPEASYIEEFTTGKIQHYWRMLNSKGFEIAEENFNNTENINTLQNWARFAIENYFHTLIKDDHMSKYLCGLVDILKLLVETADLTLIHNPSSVFFKNIGLPNPTGEGFRYKKSHVLWKKQIYDSVMSSNKKEFFTSFLNDENNALNFLYQTYGKGASFSPDEVATREFG